MPILPSTIRVLPRCALVTVRDPERARAVLRAAGELPDDPARAAERVAAVVRGELVVIRGAVAGPLDAPAYDAIPLLSELVGGVG